MAIIPEDELRVVRLQLLDELTGEPLDYVNVLTNARSVLLSEGDTVQEALEALSKELYEVAVTSGKLQNSMKDIWALQDKLIGIEPGANHYVLPPANVNDIGGVKPGPNMIVDRFGEITAANILFGETKASAVPVDIFLQVASVGGPSTMPKVTITATHSYITAEGNIINYVPSSTKYQYINAKDGSSLTGLTKAQVEERLVRGLELIDKTGLTWYHTNNQNIAVNSEGNGFRYEIDRWVFIDYIYHDEYIELLQGDELQPGISPELSS